MTRPNDERRSRVAARPDPHAGRQHGHRRHRGLLQDPGDRRRRLPRRRPRAQDLEFALGFSHPVVRSTPPEGITFAVETPDPVPSSGIDKQQVGEVAANIRKLRKPDPYKGKGVRYAGEVIRRKVGKAGK